MLTPGRFTPMLNCADASDGTCRTAATRIIENKVRMIEFSQVVCNSLRPPNPTSNAGIVARVPRPRHPRMYLNGDRPCDP